MGWIANRFRRAPKKVVRIYGDGTYSGTVVGKRSFQHQLHQIAGSDYGADNIVQCVAQLVPKPGIFHDSNAIMVVIQEMTVGYLDTGLAPSVLAMLKRRDLEVAEVNAIVVANRQNLGIDRAGRFNVILDLPNDELL